MANKVYGKQGVLFAIKLMFLIVICERNVCFFVVLHNHGLLY